MLNDIQITSDYMSRWVVLKRRVGAVTSQRVLNVLFYVNILQCFFVVENFTADILQKPLGIQHIRTILFSLPVNYLKDLRDFGLDKGGLDPFSPKYRLSSIICDVASFRLFKPVRRSPVITCPDGLY
jgi:hypothetical protein